MALVLILSACGSSESAESPQPADGEVAAERFFGELAQKYSENDFYGVLDFYAPGAVVEIWRGDNRGGSRVSELLKWNSGDLAQDVLAVYLGEHEALTLVRWPVSGNLGAIVSAFDGALIAGETTFDLAAELDQSLRALPATISFYEDLLTDHAHAWSTTDPASRARLYAEDATIRDPVAGIEVNGRDAIVALPAQQWTALDTAELGLAPASPPAPAVYLGPARYGDDPLRAVGVFSVVDAAKCDHRVAVRWVIEDGRIRDEERFQDTESLRNCRPTVSAQGWWSDLRLPGPSDEVVTGTFATSGGQRVAVRNGTPLLETLVAWGFGRFSLAGLPEPRIDSIVFEPSRSCQDRSGRVLDDGVARELFVCIYETEVCNGTDECAVPATSARLTVLHELSHAWMIDQVAPETEAQLLELTRREAWNDLDVPWIDRGVEYAADVLAWGLIDERLTMVRLGAPPCQELVAAYQLLTGTSTPPIGAGC